MKFNYASGGVDFRINNGNGSELYFTKEDSLFFQKNRMLEYDRSTGNMTRLYCACEKPIEFCDANEGLGLNINYQFIDIDTYLVESFGTLENPFLGYYLVKGKNEIPIKCNEVVDSYYIFRDFITVIYPRLYKNCETISFKLSDLTRTNSKGQQYIFLKLKDGIPLN
jgi:hypothetical protein